MHLDTIKEYYAYTKALVEVNKRIKNQKPDFINSHSETEGYKYNNVNFITYKDNNDTIYAQNRKSYNIDYDKLRENHPELIVEKTILKSVPQLINGNQDYKSTFTNESIVLATFQTQRAKNDNDVNLIINNLLDHLDTIPNLLSVKASLNNNISILKSQILDNLKSEDKIDNNFVSLKSKKINNDILDTIITFDIDELSSNSNKLKRLVEDIHTVVHDNNATYKALIDANIDLSQYCEIKESITIISINDPEKCNRMIDGMNKISLKDLYLSSYLNALTEGDIDKASTLKEYYFDNNLKYQINKDSLHEVNIGKNAIDEYLDMYMDL